MLKKKKSRPATEINSGSMADIAFLLLIFFLVTTTIASDKGISVLLPPKKENQDDIKIKQKNIFNILINSRDMLLVEEEPAQVEDLNAMVKKFVTNRGVDPTSSDNPHKAIVSLKTDRGTSYETYVTVYDELKQAYNELKAEYLGITLAQFMALDKKNPDHKKMLKRAKEEYPVNISDAEPTDISKLGR